MLKDDVGILKNRLAKNIENKNYILLNDDLDELYFLEEYEFIHNLFYELLSLNLYEKRFNKILLILIKSNVKLKKYKEVVKFWELYKKNIHFEYKIKGSICNFVAFSYLQIKEYDIAREIFYEIKHLKSDYNESYIDCLVQCNELELALKETKRYKPHTEDSKIWKQIILCEIYNKNDNLEMLKIEYRKAKQIYNKYKYSNINIHSGYLYLLGTFAQKLGNINEAIFNYKNSVIVASNGVIDSLYKELSIDKLSELGVSL